MIIMQDIKPVRRSTEGLVIDLRDDVPFTEFAAAVRKLVKNHTNHGRPIGMFGMKVLDLLRIYNK